MYEIHRAAEYTEQMAALTANFNRLNQAIQIMEILLSRNPERGGVVAGIALEGWRFMRTKPFPGVPRLIIFYRLNVEDNRVILLRAEECPDQEEADHE